MPSCTVKRQILIDGVALITAEATQTGTLANIAGPVAVANGATNQAVPLSLTLSNTQVVILFSDRDVTVKTNSTGAPDQTLSLKANKPLAWQAGDADGNPITTNLTTLYVSNASGQTASFQAYTLYN